MFEERINELRELMNKENSLRLLVSEKRNSLVIDMCKADVREIPIGLNLFRLVWATPEGIKMQKDSMKLKKQRYTPIPDLMEVGKRYSFDDLSKKAGFKKTSSGFREKVREEVFDGVIKEVSKGIFVKE